MEAGRERMEESFFSGFGFCWFLRGGGIPKRRSSVCVFWSCWLIPLFGKLGLAGFLDLSSLDLSLIYSQCCCTHAGMRGKVVGLSGGVGSRVPSECRACPRCLGRPESTRSLVDAGDQEKLTMPDPIGRKYDSLMSGLSSPSRNTLLGRRSVEQSPMRDGDETAIYVGAGGVAECDMQVCMMGAWEGSTPCRARPCHATPCLTSGCRSRTVHICRGGRVSWGPEEAEFTPRRVPFHVSGQLRPPAQYR